MSIIGSARTRDWTRGHSPRIRVRFGPPIEVEPAADARRARAQAVAGEALRQIRLCDS